MIVTESIRHQVLKQSRGRGIRTQNRADGLVLIELRDVTEYYWKLC